MNIMIEKRVKLGVPSAGTLRRKGLTFGRESYSGLVRDDGVATRYREDSSTFETSYFVAKVANIRGTDVAAAIIPYLPV
ncbi:hypothetical protein AVEN_67159-1 [Araneus ventricosus]|uniref:Uncharacterized protein n=1 Tax=Araneus ventricosus TaxID=182803 RepID=A0A4Y2UZE0_ARAVE|nr:hypothetical protein AVEN_67159-1 [Araneus ventricosus]